MRRGHLSRGLCQVRQAGSQLLEDLEIWVEEEGTEAGASGASWNKTSGPLSLEWGDWRRL